jgi:PEP-CTERM motif
MKKWGTLCCFVIAFLLLASAAKADTLKFTGASGTITLNVSDADSGYQNVNAVIDPYLGILNGNAVTLWCVDPDHQVSINNMWNVNVSYLGGNLSSTYLGASLGQAGAQTAYGEMAWLITLLQAASNTTVRQEIQAAIWLIAEGGLGGDFTVNVNNSAFWNNVNWYIANAPNHVLTSGFEILTDLAGQKQEFIVITSEPATFLLFGVGLIGLFLFAQWKKARVADSGV